MKAIEMPAWRLTANCIWNSFRSSGKKHLFLTGSKHSGKTTLLRSLGADQLPGLTTWAIPQTGVWMRENQSSNTAQIGSFDPNTTGADNRMRPISAGFERLGIPALQQSIANSSEWTAIDEIGYLETTVPSYCQALLSLMEAKHVLAVIRKQNEPFLQQLLSRDDAFVIDLDAPYGHIGCVIMASGLGKRFGGNKLMADFHGQPMIAHCLAATADVPHRVVVTRHADVAAYCKDRGVPTLLHNLPLRSDTVRLGIEAMADTSACMFSPADQPLLSRDTVHSLMLSSMAQPHRIWRTAFEQEPGAPVLFPAWTYAELAALPEGKGGGFIAKKYPEQVYTIPVRDRFELLDVDTPDDLKLLMDR